MSSQLQYSDNIFVDTEKGKYVFDEHRKGHLAWEKRDLGFLRSYPAEKLSEIVEFLEAFDRHLRSLLEE